jgi:hypothetical protein
LHLFAVVDAPFCNFALLRRFVLFRDIRTSGAVAAPIEVDNVKLLLKLFAFTFVSYRTASFRRIFSAVDASLIRGSALGSTFFIEMQRWKSNYGM